MREGDSVGHYVIVRELGAGGMGTVFLAAHKLIGRHAAIKVLHPKLSGQRENVDRFFNEARATTAVADPGIVQLFDFGLTDDNVAYIVMELLEGESLHDRLRRLGSFAPDDALRITRQIAGSLAAAHAAGIIHRDLKPDNLFIVRDAEAPGGERTKILDFGVAKLAHDISDRVRTRTGQMVGTPLYMSPEQCNGVADVDHRADVYSLGCLLFHFLTGRPPFDEPSVAEIIAAHLTQPPLAPSACAPHISRALDDVVLRCLAKSPADRFSTMTELQHACDALLATAGDGLAVANTLPLPMFPGVTPPQPPPAEHVRTTLGASTGEAIAVRRRRGGLFVALSVTVGIGLALALVIARTGRHDELATPSRPEFAASPQAPIVAPPDAGAIAAAPVPATPVDAAVAVAPVDVAPLAAAPSVVRPPAAAKPHSSKGKRPATAKPAADGELYDDRN